MILSITVFKALLGQVQLFLCIIKAFELFQAEVAPHDVQLEDRIVVHSVQQLFALTTREGSLSWLNLSALQGSLESFLALGVFLGLTNRAFIYNMDPLNGLRGSRVLDSSMVASGPGQWLPALAVNYNHLATAVFLWGY